MRVSRQDYGAIKRSSPTPQGGLKLDAWITRTGVLKYQRPDGTVTRELRHPDEVFKPESLATFQHAPLTDLHPSGRVDASNYSFLSRGHLTNDVQAAEDGKHVAASILVQDSEMLSLIDRGERKELSCGYSCDLDETPGEYEGERYDAVQRNIVGNHVAALPVGAGRAGPTAALRLDGLCVAERKDSRTMATINIDGLDLEVGSAAHIKALENQRDAVVKAATARADAAEKALTEERARRDAAEVEAKVAGLESLAQKAVKARFEVDAADLDTVATTIAAAFKLDAKNGLGAIKKYLDSMHAAADAFAKMQEEDDPEADGNPEGDKANPFAKKKKDAADADDIFTARARAEGNGSNSSTKRANRIDHATSHANMIARMHSMSRPKDAS